MGLVSIFLFNGAAALLLLMGPLMVSGDKYEPKDAAAQGIVYCKPCKYQGVETVLGASPHPGAVVKLECQNKESRQTIYATTDTNGYFFLHRLKNYRSYGFGQCKVFLVSSPNGSRCNKFTGINQGQNGAPLDERNSYIPEGSDFRAFTVGPFAFEPSSCPR